MQEHLQGRHYRFSGRRWERFSNGSFHLLCKCCSILIPNIHDLPRSAWIGSTGYLSKRALGGVGTSMSMSPCFAPSTFINSFQSNIRAASIAVGLPILGSAPLAALPRIHTTSSCDLNTAPDRPRLLSLLGSDFCCKSPLANPLQSAHAASINVVFPK